MSLGRLGARGGFGSYGALGGVIIFVPPNAPAGARLLLGADGAPLTGADGAYLFGVA